MTVNEGCPKCNGRCCDYGLDPYRGAHRSEAFHTCLACTNGTKPTVWTAEQERAAVVAWLRGDAGFRMVSGEMAYCDYYADCIERGEHRNEETE